MWQAKKSTATDKIFTRMQRKMTAVQFMRRQQKTHGRTDEAWMCTSIVRHKERYVC